MRKHDVRKWLHAVLDLLPVILIPVFMIYSHRHTLTENVEVNYKYQSNEVNTLDDLIEGNIYHFNIDNVSLDEVITNNTDFTLNLLHVNSYDFDNYEINFDEYLLLANNDTGNVNIQLYFGNNFNLNIYIYLINNQSDDALVSLSISDLDSYSFSLDCVAEFVYYNGSINTSYISYTDYNVIESVETKNTNIMDSFMNNFNDNIDKHFNMGNVFNLGGVYQWFNTNIFGGNAPQVIYSIWNIALYELVMDLLFLLYGLFMWFIDMVQKLMEKPLNSVK